VLPAVAVFWLLVSEYRLRSGLRLAGAAVLAIAFAFNGVALAAARNPHFEMLIIGAGLLFFTALVRKKYVLAGIFFCLCLLTREDAGFDLFALLAADASANMLKSGKFVVQRPLFAFAACALFYSVAVLAVERAFLPGDHALTRVYLGSPPFHDLSWCELTNRLAFFAAYRLYIFLPAYVAFLWGVAKRMPEIYAGFVAVLPWLGLNWLAVSPIASTLSNYYSFPVIFSLFWPLVGGRLNGGAPLASQARDRQLLTCFSVLLACSFTEISFQHNPGRIGFPESFYGVPSLQVQRSTDQAVQNFVKFAPSLGRVAVDGSIIALAPNDYKASQLVWMPQEQMPDTVIFFQQDLGTTSAMQLAKLAGLHEFFLVSGTSIRVASRKALNLSQLGLSTWKPDTAFK